MRNEPNLLPQQYWNQEKQSASMIASYSQKESSFENKISFYVKRGPKYYMEVQTDNCFNHVKIVSPEEVRNNINLYKMMYNIAPVFYSDKLMDELYKELAQKSSAFQGTYIAESQFDHKRFALVAEYSSDKINFLCYRDPDEDSLDYYCKMQNIKQADVPSGIIKMSPKQMSNTINFLNCNCKWERGATDFTKTLSRDVSRSKDYTDLLIHRLEDLSDINADISKNADATLNQFVKDEATVSYLPGTAQKIFDLYRNPTQKETVEQMFELFTGMEINDYLNTCLQSAQEIEQSSEEELDEI